MGGEGKWVWELMLSGDRSLALKCVCVDAATLQKLPNGHGRGGWDGCGIRPVPASPTGERGLGDSAEAAAPQSHGPRPTRAGGPPSTQPAADVLLFIPHQPPPP
ncbi:hypothetical protein CC85DRAFT_283929 [Cutaneotrichosporon oleaginosum]|uniref:Uncharacterized protein n=1 Tax=Cutaneotrichosporon oleaginosum TaxID=879819 RepID=A0A0J0XSV5_9TREE|nr:uncharacterized protein CC85DRAFT_283929 [Cutaneotrichosporon oleaginosum]KLT44140.1 hypothetical protein CC85DRAFT_283929 [Cutaneotrichosporon oleaginosum]TXT09405.1 hypothetical protein COLE_03339 [Cutaneotrichosporon oleaginosum]